MKIAFLFLILVSQSLFAEEVTKMIQSDKLIILWDDLPELNSHSGMTTFTLQFDLPEVDAIIIKDSGLKDQTCQGQRKAGGLFRAFFAKGLKEIKVMVNPPCNVRGLAKMKLLVRSKGKTYFNDFVFSVKYYNRSEARLDYKNKMKP